MRRRRPAPVIRCLVALSMPLESDSSWRTRACDSLSDFWAASWAVWLLPSLKRGGELGDVDNRSATAMQSHSRQGDLPDGQILPLPLVTGRLGSQLGQLGHQATHLWKRGSSE